MYLRYGHNSLAASRPRGFTVCELLVAISCIGVLLALLLPAVVYARESARRITCNSHLREIGIAIQSYHGRQCHFPTAWRRLKTEPSFIRGWATELLPELGEPAIASSLRSSPHAANELSGVSLPTLLCPSDIIEPTFVIRAEEEEYVSPSATRSVVATRVQNSGAIGVAPTASYVGVFGTTEADEQNPDPGEPLPGPSDGTIVHDRRVRIADLERGTSSTLLVGERTMAVVPSTWLGVSIEGEDAQCRLVGSAMTRPNCEECDECEFSSRHLGGANFLWADGHVALIRDDVETALYRLYSQRFAR